MSTSHNDLQAIAAAYDALERDAQALVSGLTEGLGTWRPDAGSWSVAECLDHLAVTNRVYLEAMTPPADVARAAGRARRGPALPGLLGGWFVRSLEPPVKVKARAPSKIAPRTSPPLAEAFVRFTASQAEVREFLSTYADIDLASVRFPNPFVRGIRFSLATGLHAIAAHERRHLWQARRVRDAAEQSTAARELRP